MHYSKNTSKPYSDEFSHVFYFFLMKAFNSVKNSLIGLRSGEYGGKYVHQFDSGFIAQLLNLFYTMKGCVVHYNHRPWFRLPAIMQAELLYKIFKDVAFCCSLEHAREDLVASALIQLSNPNRSNTKRRPTSLSEPN